MNHFLRFFRGGQIGTIVLILTPVLLLWAIEATDGSSRNLFFRMVLILCLMTLCIMLVRIALKRNAALAALNESSNALITITNSARDAIVMMDDRGTISFWNPAAEEIFGYASYEAIGRELHILLAPPRYHSAYREGFHRFQRTGKGPRVGSTMELTAVRKDGTEFPVEISLSALPLQGKWCAVAVLRDITGRKRAEEELRAHREKLEHLVAERTEELIAVNELLQKEINDRSRTEEELYRSETFLNTIFDSIHDPFSIVDRDYRIVRFNDAYARMQNKAPGKLFGKRCYEVLRKRSRVCDECVIEKTFQSKDPCAKEKQITLPNGSTAWVEIYTYPIFDQKKNVTHVVEYTRDITERKRAEKEKKELIRTLNLLSTTDGLTGLYNRRALNDQLRQEIGRAKRYGCDLSLILCDIDLFKSVNDTYGHTAGDRALQAVSQALRQSLRNSDMIGRYGGDEFMIILPETPLEGARILAEKVRAAVKALDLAARGNERIRLSLSIGVASCRSPEESVDSLLALADTALYAAKEAGRDTVSS
jgi:diguanylate cyclase (GGDEF)-like protein/PAS domain S-box-containing protein